MMTPQTTVNWQSYKCK